MFISKIEASVYLIYLPTDIKADYYGHPLSLSISGVSKTSLACDVAVSCLKRIVLEFQLNHLDYLKDIATIIFPLLLVQRKVSFFFSFLFDSSAFYVTLVVKQHFGTIQTWRLNLEALALVKQMQWPFYVQSSITNVQIALEQMKVRV